MATIIALTLGSTSEDGGHLRPTTQTVNPNLAPWHELTVLPRVGETIAREIVRHRESVAQRKDARAQDSFSSAADLDDVRGIGPITVQRIAPYLRFDGR